MPGHWRPVVGYEGRYQVSDQGEVWSLLRKQMLKPQRNRHSAHVQVRLYDHGQWRARLVHQLVLEAFVGPRQAGQECCHANDVGDDNRLENLRWDTTQANRLDMVRNGNHNMARKTHCKNDHEFTFDNTYITPDGRRQCRICLNERSAKWRNNKEKESR